MAWVFPDEATPTTDALREQLLNDMAVVPVIWPVEVGNVLLVATRSGRIRQGDLKRIHGNLDALPIEIDSETTERTWQSVLPLAWEHKLSAYDATYLALAMRLKIPLATLDKALRAACDAVRVEVL
jgi:predicted nucleic acid-binding protein